MISRSCPCSRYRPGMFSSHPYLHSSSGFRRRPRKCCFLLALLVILIVAGAGFALHLLWWVAIAALVIWLISFFMRR